jgi:hypothetical protein
MVDGRWTMDDGRWTMDDGRWPMDDDEDDGRCRLEVWRLEGRGKEVGRRSGSVLPINYVGLAAAEYRSRD